MLNFQFCLENDDFSWKSAWKWQFYPWKITHPDLFLFVSLPWIIINESHLHVKKKSKKGNFHLPFLSDLWLMVNYMEIQDFVELPCNFFTAIHLVYTPDSENVLENCENVLEKVLEKCLNFFSVNLYSPCYLNQCWPDSLMHICVTRGKSVNSWEILKLEIINFLTNFNNWWLWYLFWNCHEVIVTGTHW